MEELPQNETLKSVNGVKRESVLSKHLAFLHPVQDSPPDILHDFFEGVIPIESALCLRDLISKGFFPLDGRNHSIKPFPYKYSKSTNLRSFLKPRFQKALLGAMVMRIGR